MVASWARRRKRALTEHDTRPDWRDPDMKCFETVLFSDGKERECYIPPETMQKFAQQRMEQYQTAVWINDPTYDLRVRKP